jgi:hypothetical protein
MVCIRRTAHPWAPVGQQHQQPTRPYTGNYRLQTVLMQSPNDLLVVVSIWVLCTDFAGTIVDDINCGHYNLCRVWSRVVLLP